MQTYICTETKIQQYAAHNLHTERTQNAHTQHREQRTTLAQNNTLVRTVIHIYSFVFIAYNNISKNSIIQLYTNYIQTIYILVTLLMR